MNIIIQREKKSTPPSALVVFTHGFHDQQTPMIVPNGGSEEIDNLIIEWFRKNLATRRRAAA